MQSLRRGDNGKGAAFPRAGRDSPACAAATGWPNIRAMRRPLRPAPLNSNYPNRMLEEFKKFILKGNMVDLAIGVIIGASFGKVVERFAEMLMSAIGWLLSVCQVPTSWLEFCGIDHSGVKLGGLVTAAITLVIVGFALFLFVKAYNRWLQKPAPAKLTATEQLLTEIRDALRKQDGA